MTEGRKIAACAVLMLAMLSAPALAITPAPPKPPLFDFGEWIIVDRPGEKDTLRLVARSDEAYSGLEIECLARSSVVRLIVPSNPDAAASEHVTVTVWNERETRSSVRLLKTGSGDLVAVFDRRKAGDGPPGIHPAFATLRDARKFVALEVSGQKRQFDATRLQAAFQKLESACSKLR